MIFWLRASYWVGAFVDVVAGLIMSVPALYALFNQQTGFTATPAFLNVAWMGAPLMFGWTVLLLWADRKPVERRAVLLITLIPIIGNAIDQVVSVYTGFYPLSVAIPQWFIQAILITLFTFSFFYASRTMSRSKSTDSIK
ncbi:MAG: hypothetical protein C0410_00080 [Anaerolinea sp.]|nr:hypothetical protein [Anaerolinea sp.]